MLVLPDTDEAWQAQLGPFSSHTDLSQYGVQMYS